MSQRAVTLFLLLLLSASTTVGATRHALQRLTTEDGLPSNTVRNIVQDSRGFIWLGTDAGLCRYDGTAVRTLRIPENGVNQYIMSLQPQGDSLLVGTPSGVYSYLPRTESFRRHKEMKLQPTGRGDRLQSHDGRLWIGTWEEGLMLVGDGNKSTQVVSPLLHRLGNHIHKLYEYDDRYILMGCDEGLVAYDMDSGNIELWDTPKFVYAIAGDHEGGLWLGTFYDGVYYMNNATHRFDGVAGHVIARFCQDTDGRLWIASDDAGLCCLKNGAMTDYPGRDLLSQHNVHALQADDDGLWVGTYSAGIYRLSGSSLRHYTTADGLPDNSCYVMLRDGSTLWAGTMGTLCRYDAAADSFAFVRPLEAMSVSMAVDRNHRLWIATQGAGIYSYDGKQWKQYRQDALGDDQINCVVAARDGRLWVGAQSGLCLYSPEKDQFERLLDVPVSSIVEPEEGAELWLSTAQGVLKYLPASGETVTFTREDGLVSLQFQPNAGFRTADGRIYFGTANGYSSFLPTTIRTNPLQPTVYITGLDVFNQGVSVGSELLPEALTYGGVLRLSYDDRMFSLHYAALSYASPSKNQYAYRLEGFDRDWNYVGSQTKATYTNLPAGRYTFSVKATNNDGLWTDEATTITIVVSPPWWWSWPARILYLLLLIGAVWYYTRLRLRRAEQRYQAEIHQLSEAKEREAREARLSFFTMIAHEIRTPVTLIIGPLDEIKKKLKAPSQQDDHSRLSMGDLRNSLNVIDRNAHRLLELVNQLLDFRKVEQKDMPMRFAPHNIGQMLRNVCERFAPTFEQNGRRFTVSYPEDHLTAFIDAEAVTKVVSNLLTNANKYSKSRVDVRCFEAPAGDSFHIEVEDDGIGISDADRERIFQPFYQAADNKPGTGIGLSIVHNIVSQHGGTITVESQVGKGSKFIVVLPLKQSQQAMAQPAADELAETDAAMVQSTAAVVPSYAPADDAPGGSMAPAGLLLVDDHQDMLDYTAQHFREHYDVVIAHDGIEALDKLQTHNISLIVSDWMMPRMDGAELCRRVRSNASTSHIPFIMLTAKTDDASKVEGMGVGADAYVEKPFSIQYLEGIIRNTLDMRRRLFERLAREPLEPVAKIANNPTDNDFLLRMNELIEQNFANPDLNVNFLAEQLAISRSGLFAKIKMMADVTPNEMIQLVRLKRAAQLLRESSLTVSEVCYRVGFSSPSYFTKCFTRQFGIKPTEWKERRQ